MNKERPILFNADMVRAILEGRKTQTRRIVKPQPIPVERCRELTGTTYSLFNDSFYPDEWRIGGPVGVVCDESNLKNGYHWRCPFGKVGDVLWVRETFLPFDLDWRYPGRPHDLKDGPWPNIAYEADQDHDRSLKWRPSIHMPRWASRINLEITGVRVERLQDISEDDALAEGFTSLQTNEVFPHGAWSARQMFGKEWIEIYGKESFDKNPWVWCISFKVKERTGDEWKMILEKRFVVEIVMSLLRSGKPMQAETSNSTSGFVGSFGIAQTIAILRQQRMRDKNGN